jgi:hypothetical protein
MAKCSTCLADVFPGIAIARCSRCGDWPFSRFEFVLYAARSIVGLAALHRRPTRAPPGDSSRAWGSTEKECLLRGRVSAPSTLP